MRKIEVSLIVTTTALTLSEISSRLGHSHSSGSHEKGTPRHVGAPFDCTIWRLDSAVGRSASLEKHFESLASRLPAEVVRRPGVLPDDVAVYLDIVVYFDTPMCTISIPLACADMAKAYSADIEISCYPCDFESEGEKGKMKR